MGCIKSKHKHVPVPWPLASYSRQEWIAWRSCFLTYANETYIPAYKQGNQFFELIGNIGLQISKNFYYNNSASETDIDTLLFKFDVYFIFCGRKKHNNESIDDYVLALKEVAEKTAKSNTEKVIKEKVLQDLKAEQILEQFSKIVPSFSNISDCESLALHELMFIWRECSKSVEVNQHLIKLEARKRDALEQIQMKEQCLKCDRNHQGKKCVAIGKQCWKCGDFNHFARCCTKTYIKDCPFCGLNHIQNKCSAFAKECSKCKKMNHFSWKCFSEIYLSCDFCGRSHINNRQQCPAKSSMCNNCHKVGHFSFKCKSRRNSRNKK